MLKLEYRIGFSSTSTCDVVPFVHGFVRAASFLHALSIVCVPEMTLCGLMILACLTEVPCQKNVPFCIVSCARFALNHPVVDHEL